MITKRETPNGLLEIEYIKGKLFCIFKGQYGEVDTEEVKEFIEILQAVLKDMEASNGE